jgi:hypothetical protein
LLFVRIWFLFLGLAVVGMYPSFHRFLIVAQKHIEDLFKAPGLFQGKRKNWSQRRKLGLQYAVQRKK